MDTRSLSRALKHAAPLSVTILLLLLLAACSSASPKCPACPPPPKPEVIEVTQTVEVKVPVYIKASVPLELRAGLAPPRLPSFVAVDHPEATSALTPEGEQALRHLIHYLYSRDHAWRAWATQPVEDSDGDQQ